MNATQVQSLYSQRRARYTQRDERMRRVRDSLKGELNANMRRLGAQSKDPVVGNLVLSTVRTLAQRVGKPPRLHAVSRLDSETAKHRAEKHEKLIADRLDRQNFNALLPQAAFWLAPSGFLPFVLTLDKALGQARIRIRDPLTCYPNTVWPHEPGVTDCMFVYRMSPIEVQAAFPEFNTRYQGEPTDQLTVCEYHGADSTDICIVEPEPIVVASLPNPLGQCNVFVARDLTPDFDFHGQFDQVIPIMEAEARLMSLVEAYIEQGVTSETVVVGEITSNDGDWAHGLGGVNVLEPAPGARAEKLTNNMSPQVFQTLGYFERAQRETGSIPAQLQGEPNVSFATGRGIEKLSVAVDDNVSHYQNILALTLKEVFNRIPAFEAAYGLPNPGFAPDVTVYAQFKVGADPAMDVSLLQKVGAKTLARRSAMEQDILIEDPEKEQRTIVVEAMEEALIGNVLAQAQQGAADPNMLLTVIAELGNGKNLDEALKEYFASQAPPASPSPSGGLPGGGASAPPGLEALLGLSQQGKSTGGVQQAVPVK